MLLLLVVVADSHKLLVVRVAVVVVAVVAVAAAVAVAVAVVVVMVVVVVVVVVVFLFVAAPVVAVLLVMDSHKLLVVLRVVVVVVVVMAAVEGYHKLLMRAHKPGSHTVVGFQLPVLSSSFLMPSQFFFLFLSLSAFLEKVLDPPPMLVRAQIPVGTYFLVHCHMMFVSLVFPSQFPSQLFSQFLVLCPFSFRH